MAPMWSSWPWVMMTASILERQRCRKLVSGRIFCMPRSVKLRNIHMQLSASSPTSKAHHTCMSSGKDAREDALAAGICEMAKQPLPLPIASKLESALSQKRQLRFLPLPLDIALYVY